MASIACSLKRAGAMPLGVRQSVFLSLSLATHVAGASLKARGASLKTRGVSLLALDQPEYPFLPLARGHAKRKCRCCIRSVLSPSKACRQR
ncbi:MAG TPA: hypothetical protein VFV57_02465, partial [Limnobacter sp.]|nr:hypothetical protein [Limnobacter sp.]